MARVIRSDGAITFFAISQGVGTGLPNTATDSMLVLYLLWKYAAFSTGHPNDMGVPTFNPNKDYNNPRLVSEAIRGFQIHNNKLVQEAHISKNSLLKVDGRAHCPPNWFTNKLYTIQQINYSYRASVITFFNNDKDPMELALNDHQMPLLLRAELVASSVFYGVL